ncbi:MAG: 2'-5' RNA ligase family protein [Thermomicrobiales bacterium]|nr:2'-5' RNA ligase family protein [Thermomicrobiales bacterium]
MSGREAVPQPPSQYARAYQRVWSAFLQARETADGRHDTDAWRSRAEAYAACIIRVPAADLEPDLGHLQRRLAEVRGVRVHPSGYLHITLQELGFLVDHPARSGEISPARLEEFAQSAIEPVSTTPSFAISLGPANSFEDAVFLEVGGGEAVARLHEKLFDLAAIPVAPAFSYLPHCTVAHYDGTASPAEAIAAIEPWRARIFDSFRVSEVEIVTFDPALAYPDLETYAVIPLEG